MRQFYIGQHRAQIVAEFDYYSTPVVVIETEDSGCREFAVLTPDRSRKLYQSDAGYGCRGAALRDGLIWATEHA